MIVIAVPLLMAASCNTGTTTTNNGNNANDNTGDQDPPTNTLKCDSANPAADIPWIKSFAEGIPADVKAEVTRYQLNGEYFFMTNNCVGCSDAMTTLYTCDQGEKCKMGGIAGLNTCGDFFDQAGEGTVVWRNYEPAPGK